MTAKKSRFQLSPFRLLCGIGLFAIFSSTMSKSPVLPLFAEHLGATESVVGLIAAASTVVGILVSVPAGALSDVFGRRKVILFATFIFASAPFLYLPIVNAWQLVLARVYHGFATAIFGPVALALVADLFVQQRGEKMGWYSSATLIGRSAAPFIGGFLLTLFAASVMWHYRMVYLVCGVAGTLAFLIAFRLPIQKRTVVDEKSESTKERFLTMFSGLSMVVRHRGILFTSVAEAVQFFGYGAYEIFLPLYADFIGMSPSLIGILLGAKVLTLTFSKPLMGKISDRYGRRGQIMLGLAAGALGLSLIPFFRSFWILLLLSLLLGLSMATVTASTAALVADLATGAYGSALGVMSTIMDVGHASGPPVTGYLISVYGKVNKMRGYRFAYPIVGGLLLLMALLFPLMVREPKRDA
ncbi:TPA: MFS transporter [Candidatus Poribacteria bacterium]|nr:MFS transporter [Candidatus Poribacteria bacterium]